MPIITVRETEDGQAKLDVRCCHCAAPQVLEVAAADYARYLDRSDLIQNIFPYIEARFRELLVSGICPDCGLTIFGTPETDREDEEGEE